MATRHKIIFESLQKELYADASAAHLLSNYLRALKNVYSAKDQQDVLFDLENSIYLKLKEPEKNPVSHVDVLSVIAETLGLSSEKLTQKLNRSNKSLFLDKSESRLGGVCVMISRLLNIKALYVRFLYIILILINPLFLLWYIILWIVVPSKQNHIEYTFTYLIKVFAGEQHDTAYESEKKGQNILHSMYPVVIRAIGLIMTFTSVWLGCITFYTSTGLFLQRFNLWPQSLHIQSSLNQLQSFPFIFIMLLQYSGLLLISALLYIMGTSLSKLRTPFNGKWRNYVTMFMIGVIMTGISSYMLNQESNRANLSESKVVSTNNMKMVAVLNNSLCNSSEKYRIIVKKNDQSGIGVYGQAETIQNIAIDNTGPDEYDITHIYPFQTCWYKEKEEIDVIISTSEPIILKDYNNSSVIVMGFGKGEIEVEGVKEVIYSEL